MDQCCRIYEEQSKITYADDPWSRIATDISISIRLCFTGRLSLQKIKSLWQNLTSSKIPKTLKTKSKLRVKKACEYL